MTKNQIVSILRSENKKVYAKIPFEDIGKLEQKLSLLEARLLIDRETERELGDDDTAKLIQSYTERELKSVGELKQKLQGAKPCG